MCLIPDADPETLPSFTEEFHLANGAGRQVTDFSIPHPSPEMPPSVSWTSGRAAEPADWGGEGKVPTTHPTHPQLPPGGSGAGVRAPPRGGAGPSSPRPAARGAAEAAAGGRARCTSAGRSPGPWRCRSERPPAPRRCGRTVSARRWPRSAQELRAWIPRASLCACLPRVGQPNPEPQQA